MLKFLLSAQAGLAARRGFIWRRAAQGISALSTKTWSSFPIYKDKFQFGTDDIGALKTTAMGARLKRINPHIHVREYRRHIDENNARSIIDDYDLVLDGTDDFAARFTVNAACLATNAPLISGALGRFDGQLAAFSMDGSGPCYQCFVPAAPAQIETCAAVGVVGALAGTIGSMMAMEAVKIITGAGTPLYGNLFLYDGLNAQARTITLPKDPSCPACGRAKTLITN